MKMIDAAAEKNAVDAIVSKYGENSRKDAEKGVQGVSGLWEERDGSASDFLAFCERAFVADEKAKRRLFDKLERAFEAIQGHFHAMNVTLEWGVQIDDGTDVEDIDRLFSEYSPSAHVTEDMFANKIAFISILNFPRPSAAELESASASFSRYDWAKARISSQFTFRIPPELRQEEAEVSSRADEYIASYNLFPESLVIEGQSGKFPQGKRLLSHWNIRDEIRALYSEKKTEALLKQRALASAMERIIDGTIPKAAINSPKIVWDPVKGSVGTESEGPARYAHLLECFKVSKKRDSHCPGFPTHIDRSFGISREMSESRVQSILESVLSSDVAKRTGAYISSLTGRPLEHFDIWFSSFANDSGGTSETELDAMCRKAFPDAKAFEKAIPDMLRKLGFSPEKAAWLSERIEVDPARGSGHAMGCSMRTDKVRLRTRVAPTGMDYKGFNIAVHELGHNVEQVFSLHGIDFWSLASVPNTAFTEAFAFVFQSRDRDILGVSKGTASGKSTRAIRDFWATYEIGGVSIVDMRTWRWMYEHPDATPEQLRDAVISISRDVWNRYFAPVLGMKDSTLLAIYSHMIHSFLYLPDYPLGHIISFQIEKHLEGKNLAAEMERMCTCGSILPDRWMVEATGSPVSAEPLIAEASDELKSFGF